MFGNYNWRCQELNCLVYEFCIFIELYVNILSAIPSRNCIHLLPSARNPAISNPLIPTSFFTLFLQKYCPEKSR